MRAPQAPRVPSERIVHGERVTDEFAWMADRDDPRLSAYLAEENAYARERTAHLEPLIEAIVGEIKGRTVETDLDVPVRHGGWWYYTRTIEGADYPVHARVALAHCPTRPMLDGQEPPAAEQVLLDENIEAGDADFFALGACDVSPDGRLLAWSVDRTGDERYDLAVRDLATGLTIDDAVRDIGEGVAFSFDGTHVFYTRLDEAWRSHEVWRHQVGAPAVSDVPVLTEPDESFFMGVSTTTDDRWVVVNSSSKSTSQVWLLDAATPLEQPRTVLPRRADVLYDIEPLAEGILILHNADRANFQVGWLSEPGAPVQEIIDLGWSAENEFVTGVEAFEGFVVLSLRSGGRTMLRFVPIHAASPVGFGAPHDLTFPAETATLTLGNTPDPTSATVQVCQVSLATPAAVYDYDVHTRSLTLLKAQRVPGLDLSAVRETRIWASAPDGAAVPVSLVHHADVRPDGSAAVLLYGYGAYGIPTDSWFSVPRLSLLERGVVFAIAHVRGGTELGWNWYVQGRLENKVASITDLVACAEALVAQGWAAPDRVAIEGGSAGGLLVAAAATRAPALFRAVLAQVPFIDVLTTMLDPALPLTVTERQEWGDPIADRAAYQRIASYSPYERVPVGDFPAVVVTTSMHDTRVFVTEPAKWVARLRARVTDDPVCRPILMRTQLAAGHGGRSGRYQAWREIAWEWAVLLELLGAAAQD
ncbi:MAG: S9 family peptidase [Candidatus Phosphoribacter sp.]